MSELPERLPADNEKLQPPVGKISWSKNLILIAGGKDNLKREFYHICRDLPKVQPPVAQIGWGHNLNISQRYKDHLERKLEVLNAKAATIKKNYEELGI